MALNNSTKIKNIYRSVRDKDHPFTTVNNTFSYDPRLTGTAKSTLLYLLTKPDHWVVNVDDIKKHTADTKHAVIKSIQLLRKYGYLVTEPIRREEDAKFISWRTKVYELPPVNEGTLQSSENILGLEPDSINFEQPTGGNTLEYTNAHMASMKNPKNLENSGVSHTPEKPLVAKPLNGFTPPLVNTELLASTELIENTKRIEYNPVSVSEPVLWGGFNLDGKNTEQVKVLPVSEQIAIQLCDHLKVTNRLRKQVRIKLWAELIRNFMIEGEVTGAELREVLDWYVKHSEDQYTPGVYSVRSFIDKFPQLQAAVNRNKRQLVAPASDANSLADAAFELYKKQRGLGVK